MIWANLLNLSEPPFFPSVHHEHNHSRCCGPNTPVHTSGDGVLLCDHFSPPLRMAPVRREESECYQPQKQPQARTEANQKINTPGSLPLGQHSSEVIYAVPRGSPVRRSVSCPEWHLPSLPCLKSPLPNHSSRDYLLKLLLLGRVCFCGNPIHKRGIVMRLT